MSLSARGLEATSNMALTSDKNQQKKGDSLQQGQFTFNSPLFPLRQCH